MSDTGGDPVPADERRARAVAASARRGRVLLMAAALLLLFTFQQGLGVYADLPHRIPVHFGLAGAPDNWRDKSVFGVLGPLFVAAALLVLLSVVRAFPAWWNLPNKDRIWALPEGRRAYVLAPVSELLAWLAADLTVLFALLCREAWEVALGLRTALSPAALFVPLAVIAVALVVSLTAVSRRLREVQD